MLTRSAVSLAALVTAMIACSPGGTTTDAGMDARHDVAHESVGHDVGAGVCGNGRIEAGESCDDGNLMSGDGCSADCSMIEADWVCPYPGHACERSTVCGDGRVGSSEQCDDRNTTPGDGCSDTCMIEAGWSCPLPGVACRPARCGDGVRVGTEGCDDGNTADADGCSAMCQIEEGWQCTTPGSPCTHAVCGNGTMEGIEQCDDGNTRPYDGCDPQCHREPSCGVGPCTATCGDGVRFPGEMCDDGNTRNNDGCSATCTIETGYQCMDAVGMEPASLDIPIIYRDFRGNDLSMGHVDFENALGDDRGIVASTLAADGRPVYAHAGGSTSTTHGQAPYDQWYHDAAGVNLSVIDTLTLTRTAPGIYAFDTDSFFPLDTRGWVGMSMEPLRSGHNFSFTSELRYPFQYQGGEQLTFRGDDDVWVFIGGHLAVDLGGVHGAESGGVTLDAATAGTLGLTVGQIYAIEVFQAERHTTGSSYRLTLAGFNRALSVCHSVCGDGIVSPDEACDDGTNDGRYGGCAPGCMMLGPRCGDHMIQSDSGEQCDDGNTISGDGCSSRCQDENPG